MNYQQTTIFGVCALALACFFSGCKWPSFGFGNQKQTGLVVINVLDKSYFDDCHIKGSINVPFTEVVNYAKENLASDAHIVVYCGNYACSASGAAAKMLADAGFTHVQAFEGGSAEAVHAGLPVEGACKEEYLKQYEKPEGLQHPEGVSVITVEELKAALEAQPAKTAHSACCGK